MKEYLYKGLKKSIFITYMVAIGFILFVVIFLSNINYAYKRAFLLNNGLLLLIGVITIILLIINFDKDRDRNWIKINCFSLLLFLAQCYISFNIYFNTEEWDSWTLIWNARLIANGEINGLANEYFSWFPNNQFAVFLLSICFRLNNLLGIFDTDNGLLLIIIIQCLLSTITGKLLFEILLNFTKSKGISLVGWMLYVALVGLSGWNVVIYTDALALVFPSLILYIYQKFGKKNYLKWLLIAFLSYWGFKIKPTVIVVTIAIVLIEGFALLQSLNVEKIRRIIILFGLSVVLLFGNHFAYSKAIESTGLKINPELNTGALHMVMMGLNSFSDGGFNLDDANLSTGILDKQMRTNAQKERIEMRLSEYGIPGFLEHMHKKSLVIFNDGSFAWGCEGGFFDKVYPDKNRFMSPLLKSIYLTSGENYIFLLTLEQTLWITCLFMSIAAVVLERNKFNSVLVLSLIGIIIFNLTFEARARYLYIYVPLFICAGVLSIWTLIQKIKNVQI